MHMKIRVAVALLITSAFALSIYWRVYGVRRLQVELEVQEAYGRLLMADQPNWIGAGRLDVILGRVQHVFGRLDAFAIRGVGLDESLEVWTVELEAQRQHLRYRETITCVEPAIQVYVLNTATNHGTLIR